MTMLPPRPPFWFRLNVVSGNLLQVAGLISGAGLIGAASSESSATALRVLLLLTGWLIVYLSCHAVGHWLIGRLVGIRFRGYGVRGTDQPFAYPPPMRPVMRRLPLLTILTDKASLARVSPIRQALMFAAGELSSTLISVAAAVYAWRQAIPGSGLLLIAVLVWSAAALLASVLTPRGDFAKARRALRR